MVIKSTQFVGKTLLLTVVGELIPTSVDNTVSINGQIKANMLSLTEANPAGLVSYWKFDEGTGNTVADASGNGHGVTSNKNLVWELDDPKLGEASSVTPDLLGISLNATSMDSGVVGERCV